MKKRLIIMTMMVAVATQFAIAQFYAGVRVGGTMGNIRHTNDHRCRDARF